MSAPCFNHVFSFETTIDRTQFGMNYGIDWGFPKNVRLLVQVEAVKQ